MADDLYTTLHTQRLVKTYSRHLLSGSFERCFRGSDAVTALISRGFCRNEEEAITLGNDLVERGFIVSVKGLGKRFKGKAQSLYRFWRDGGAGRKGEVVVPGPSPTGERVAPIASGTSGESVASSALEGSVHTVEPHASALSPPHTSGPRFVPPSPPSASAASAAAAAAARSTASNSSLGIAQVHKRRGGSEGRPTPLRAPSPPSEDTRATAFPFPQFGMVDEVGGGDGGGGGGSVGEDSMLRQLAEQLADTQEALAHVNARLARSSQSADLAASGTWPAAFARFLVVELLPGAASGTAIDQADPQALFFFVFRACLLVSLFLASGQAILFLAGTLLGGTTPQPAQLLGHLVGLVAAPGWLATRFVNSATLAEARGQAAGLPSPPAPQPAASSALPPAREVSVAELLQSLDGQPDEGAVGGGLRKRGSGDM